MYRSQSSRGLAANTERRNCRRVVLAVTLLALAAIGNASRAGEAAPAQTGLAVGMGHTGDLRRNTTGGLATGNAYSHLLDLGVSCAPDLPVRR